LLLGLVAAAGLLFLLLGNDVWWLDSVLAVVIALFIGLGGYNTMAHACSKDFDGGCGCGTTKEKNVWKRYGRLLLQCIIGV